MDNKVYIKEGEIVFIGDVGGDSAVSLASQISKENYGEYVDLGTSYVKGSALTTRTATEDWRIFYKDRSDGVYLVLADYLPYSYETNETVGSKTGLNTGLKNAGSSYPNSWRSMTSRKDFLEKINDSNIWNKLISNTYIEKGITVKGALDFPTWVASWNEKFTVQLYNETATTVDQLVGYYVGFVGESREIGIHMGRDPEGCFNTLYFPRKTDTNIGEGYWLNAASASPHLYQVAYINSDGGVTAYWFEQGTFGLRPAIYLPSNIKAIKNNVTGVWEIKI